MILAALLSLAHSDLSTTPTYPQVIGGQEVAECAWIDTVAVTDSNGLCTGSLVHPRVVVYAAHCGDGNKQIRIGNTSNGGGGFTRATERCVINPEYLGTNDQAHDWAVCVLDEPITEIPITTPAFGCELEMIEAGQAVVIAGFGNNTGTGGSGTKRWAETTIISTFGSTVNIGGDGTSTCSGDSGGSAFIAMPDGSWRAISMTSTGIGCGQTGVHALMHPAIPWIEETAQIDITPCHDLDGTWNPTGACGGFYAGDETQYGTWDDWCEGTPVTGVSESCGAAYDAEPDADLPIVSITAPNDGEELPADTAVSIAIDAVDDGWGVREVWVEIDGVEQAVRDEYPPYGFDGVPFPNGGYTVQAFAIDWADNIGMSEVVAFGVGEPAPETPDDDSGTDGGSAESSADTTGPIDPSEADEGETGDFDTTLLPEQTDGGGGGGCGCAQNEGSRSGGFFALVLLASRRASRSACGRTARAIREP